jgi:hypothetical protein
MVGHFFTNFSPLSSHYLLEGATIIYSPGDIAWVWTPTLAILGVLTKLLGFGFNGPRLVCCQTFDLRNLTHSSQRIMVPGVGLVQHIFVCKPHRPTPLFSSFFYSGLLRRKNALSMIYLSMMTIAVVSFQVRF